MFQEENGLPGSAPVIKLIRDGDVVGFEDGLPEPLMLFSTPSAFSLPTAHLRCEIQKELEKALQKHIGEIEMDPLLSFSEKIKLYKEEVKKREEEEEKKEITRDAKNIFLICDRWLSMPSGAPFEHRNRDLSFEYSTFGYVLQCIRLQAGVSRPNVFLAQAFDALHELIKEMRRVSIQFPYGMEREVHEYFVCSRRKKRCHACSNCTAVHRIIKIMREHNKRPSDRQYYEMVFKDSSAKRQKTFQDRRCE